MSIARRGFSIYMRRAVIAVLLAVGACGCGSRSQPAMPSAPAKTAIEMASKTREPPPQAARPVSASVAKSTEVAAPAVPPTSVSPGTATEAPGSTSPARQTKASEPPSESASAAAAGPASLEEQLAKLQVPPPWLEAVQTTYDTSRPWKDARLEIRRLLSLNTDAARKEAVKLTWLYLKKGDIGDGHEYPMYLFLGGQWLWAIPVHEEFLARPHKETPLHAYLSLAALYTRFGAFEKGKGVLDRAMAKLPAPPWRIAREADIHIAYGDLYAAWGKTDLAREHYAEAIRLYPTSNQPNGQHLLKRQVSRVQTKLDLLAAKSLAGATLRDGRYKSVSLGYAGDIEVTMTIRDGRIADVQVKHQEKIDQGACKIIPERIIEKQRVLVDGISSATVTKDAIVDGALGCLRQAGLK